MSDIVRPETRRSRFEAPHKRRPPRTQASSSLIVCGLVAMIRALPYALERLGAMQELVDGWSETAAPVAATVPHWIDVIDGDTVRAGARSIAWSASIRPSPAGMRPARKSGRWQTAPRYACAG
jgi:hypothetical protein